MEYVVAYCESVPVRNASFLKRFRFILLTESVDRFEVIIGAGTNAILDGEIDVGCCPCSRECLYSQKTRSPPIAETSDQKWC